MKNRILMVVVAAVVLTAVGTMMFRRQNAAAPDARRVEASAIEAGLPPLDDDVAIRAIRDAGVPVQNLTVRTSGGVTIVRGTGDATASERAVGVVRSLGATRVANLITPARASNDDQLRRDVERELALAPGLHGARLAVSCKDGVVVVSGKIQRELQKDLARSTLRGLRGVREVRIELTRI